MIRGIHGFIVPKNPYGSSLSSAACARASIRPSITSIMVKNANHTDREQVLEVN